MNKFIKLKEVCLRITDGAHYSPIGIKDGYPMLSVKDMREDKFNYDECKFISVDDYNDLVRNDCKPLLNDVLIAKDGSYLKHVFVIKEETEQAILSSIGILRPDLNLINPTFLKYYLQTKSVKNTVAKKYVSGSALPRIILKNFGEIDIIYPKLLIQNKIAQTLSYLDDKIELNNQINDNLERMAKTLYDYWFVQFDFPDENGNPYKSNGGKMIWNEVLRREIPEGWGFQTIEELGTITGGSTPSKANKENFSKNDIPWITPKDLSQNIGNKFIARGEFDVTEKGFKEASLNILPANSVLMSSRAPIGYLAINRFDCTTNQGFKSIVCNKEYPFEYVFYVLKQNMLSIEANASGSTFKEISTSVLKTIKILKPQKRLVNQFKNSASVIFQQQNNLEQQNQQLTQLRDWLLPMLMNGQVKVE
ncbi:restriction endonuclease subunit S [Chryseobacterium sp.]|uniref:restriction endonuclease subunit S n=1 Tax=Chryseobacterium sp. TaxID=1871047 RepID=UPI002899F27B|nr:restriction endonuclease subunit S [Chryseobacterium sp.]